MIPSAYRSVVLIGAALVFVVLAFYFLVSKDCCSEQFSDQQVQELERAASSGSVPAMKQLFFFYDEAEQPSKAAAWLRRAADAGDSDAEFLLSHTLAGSNDAEQKRLGMIYLQRAAEHGSSSAQAALAERYRDGEGVAKNVETARFWFQRAARAGDTDAILALCDMAAADRDVVQCRECLVLESRALASLHPKSFMASQLQEQRARINLILEERTARSPAR
jgi:TPR repeat protein